MELVAALGSWVVITVLLWGLLLALLILGRLRQLLVVVIAWILQGVIIQYVLAPALRRPRPFGVDFRTDWRAWALPSSRWSALVVSHAWWGSCMGWCREGRWRQRGSGSRVRVAMVAGPSSSEWRHRPMCWWVWSSA